jgi:hypothetical protein
MLAQLGIGRSGIEACTAATPATWALDEIAAGRTNLSAKYARWGRGYSVPELDTLSRRIRDQSPGGARPKGEKIKEFLLFGGRHFAISSLYLPFVP